MLAVFDKTVDKMSEKELLSAAHKLIEECIRKSDSVEVALNLGGLLAILSEYDLRVKSDEQSRA